MNLGIVLFYLTSYFLLLIKIGSFDILRDWFAKKFSSQSNYFSKVGWNKDAMMKYNEQKVRTNYELIVILYKLDIFPNLIKLQVMLRIYLHDLRMKNPSH